MLDELERFYKEEIGCTIWMKQADCTIFKHGNMLFGLCQRESADTDAMLTFFYETPDEVDAFYDKFKDIAVGPPINNEKYDIYQFFAKDPEGRNLEFQYFNKWVTNFRSGEELLLTRRSIRKFKDEVVSDDLLYRIFDTCRYAPTSMNRQGYYFKIIREKSTLEKLSGIRESSTKPIGNGPLAVAICADPSVTKRPEQDGCIAAYHFILTAWEYGLGTCWIAAMDRDDVKQIIDIPRSHYVATITPLGIPAKFPIKTPERNGIDWYLKK